VSIGNWAPRNYTGKYAGRVSLTEALTHSYNTVPVHLMKDIGRQAILDAAKMAGLQSKLLAVPSLPLGSNEVTLIDLTTGYTAFANGGRAIKPYSVLEIRRPNGDLLYSRERNAPVLLQTVPAEKIAELNFMLANVVLNGTGRRALLGFTPQAGKTGTNQAYRDAWFVGYTGYNVTGVWFGNDDFSEMKRMTGGTLPAITWKRYMLEASVNKMAQALPGVPVDESHLRYVAENQGTGELPQGTSVNPSVVSFGTAGGDARTSTADLGDIDSSEEQAPAKPAKSSDAVVQVLQDMFSFFGKKQSGEEAVSTKKKGLFSVGERSQKKKRRAKKQNIN
jgi:penicillin-binding protein 1A